MLLEEEGAGERRGGAAGQDAGPAFERESWRTVHFDLSVFGRWKLSEGHHGTWKYVQNEGKFTLGLF